MNIIKVDLDKKIKRIKPLNCINNGPFYLRQYSNEQAYMEAKFPYARLHDSVFGHPHCVDINCVFPDFDADPMNPESYDFTLTDQYLRQIDNTGTKIFYRLGTSIEHELKKYHIYPPKDFKKWATVCEMIIRHCNEGWADGLQLDIEYWEIWNEFDGVNPDGMPPMWMGTHEEYYELYEVTARYLKEKFPQLKIGGPAITDVRTPAFEEFIRTMSERRVPIDFISWHGYEYEADKFKEFAQKVDELQKKYGYENAENILNEWNYVEGWTGEPMKNTFRVNRSMRAAAYIGAVMCSLQDSPADMAMYYDATPGDWCGLFQSGSLDLLKPYYSFSAFSKLAECEYEVYCENNNTGLYSCVAANDNCANIMLVCYGDNVEPIKCKIDVLGCNKEFYAEYYLLDREHNLKSIRKESLSVGQNTINIKMENESVLLIELRAK